MLANVCVGFVRTVVEGTEPFVERCQAAAVITFEILVMQIVKIAASGKIYSFADIHLFKPTVPGRRVERREMDLIECVHRMQCDEPLHGNGREIKNVLQRMHGKSGPGPYLNVVMVQRMYVFVKKFRVQKPMRAIKMNGVDNRRH